MAEAAPESLQTGTLARYQALLEISELIAADQHFADLFRDLNRLLCRIVPFEGIGLSLYDAARQTSQLFLLETSTSNDIEVGQTFRMEETPAAEILATQQPLYLPDLELETRYPVVTSMLRRHGIRSYCVLPLSTARRRIGGLHFASSRPYAYIADDIEFMQLVARQVAEILENV